ncbi:MAG TPA: phosphatidate cytidylyltransferase [Rhodanobacteraceae bacterium]
MLNQRTITGLVLAPIGIAVVLLLPTGALAAFTSVTVLVALWEWTRMSGFRSRPMRSAAVAIVALALVGLWLLRDGATTWYLIVAGSVWWLVAFAWLRHFSFGAAPTRENAAIKFAAGLLATLPAWAALTKLHGDPRSGPAWALLAMVLVSVADTAAYFTGRRFGKAKLCPQISPNKTIAGVYGALASGVIVSAIGGWFLHLRGPAWIALIALALVTVIASILGDLFESLVKRQAGVKDSGTLFPGHGGMFDRLDGMFAALPVFALGKALLDIAFAP